MRWRCRCPKASRADRTLVSHTLACLREQRGDMTVDQCYGTPSTGGLNRERAREIAATKRAIGLVRLAVPHVAGQPAPQEG